MRWNTSGSSRVWGISIRSTSWMTVPCCVNDTLSAFVDMTGSNDYRSAVLSGRHPRRVVVRHRQGWLWRQHRYSLRPADVPGHAAAGGRRHPAADPLHHGSGGTTHLPRSLEYPQSEDHHSGGAGRYAVGLVEFSLDE